MKENKKNMKTDHGSFLKYRENNLSGEEKNRFEKELQKDPFALEADEGLSTLEPGQIRKDLDSLSARLKKRTTGNNSVIYLRLAASVTVLAAISVIIYLLNRQSPVSETGKQVAMEIQQEGPLRSREGEVKEELKKDYTPSERPVKEVKSFSPSGARDLKTDERKKEINAGNINKNLPAAEKSEPDKEIKAENLPAAPLTRSAVVSGINQLKVSDDSIALKADQAIINVADELSAGGAGQKKAAERAVSMTRGEMYEAVEFNVPSPVTGFYEFNKYISDSILLPKDYDPVQEKVVVLGFIVRRTGVPDTITVIKSPGADFTAEALRLLKNGPAWKPAVVNGVQVTKEARVRIVFKK